MFGLRGSNTCHGPPRPWVLATAGLISLSGLAACASGTSSECPDHPVATYIGSDVSETGRSDHLQAGRLAVVRSEVEATALCHGHLKLELFSSGTGATATVFDGELEADGATPPARRRKLDETVDPTMKAIGGRWDEAESSLPSDGTDVVSQLELMAEYFAQHPDSTHRGVLLTDGVQTSGTVVLNDESVNEEVAAELAASVPVPDLTGAELTIAGFGQVADADNPPPSSFVSALKRFYRELCARTGAVCLVVSDLSVSSGDDD